MSYIVFAAEQRQCPPIGPAMPMRPLEWLLRTAMLALAGLVTLSIFGSIAAISGGTGSDMPPAGHGSEAVEQNAAGVEDEGVPGLDAERPDAPPAASGSLHAAAPMTEVAPPMLPGVDRWLEAIAYALLGVAGLLALGLIALALAVRQLRRIADAQEAGRTGTSSLP